MKANLGTLTDFCDSCSYKLLDDWLQEGIVVALAPLYNLDAQAVVD